MTTQSAPWAKRPASDQGAGGHSRCQHCPLRDLCRTEGGVVVTRLGAGEVLPLPPRGDGADPVMVLCEGCLKSEVDRFDARGGAIDRPALIAFHLDGDTVHPARGRRGQTLHTALQDSVVRRPAKGQEAGVVWPDAWTQACKRVDRDGAHLASITTQRPGERLALVLLDFLKRQGGVARDGRSAAVQLPLNRGEVAAYIGVEPETVSRALTRMEKDGLIARSGWGDIAIPDVGQLEAFAGVKAD